MDSYATPVSGPLDAAPVPAEPVLRLGQVVRVLRRNFWLIGLFALFGAVLCYAYAHTLTKSYTATSSLVVEGPRFALPELQGALRDENGPDPMPWVRTEVQALIARPLVQEVVNKLHLADDPDFNPALRPPTLLQDAKASFNALLARFMPPGPADTPPGPDEAVLNSAYRSLAEFQDNRSLVISMSFTAEDPELAARFINTLVGDYVQSRASRRTEVNQSANDVMTKRIDEVRADLAGIEQKMQDLRNSSGAVVLRAGSVGQQQVEELTTAAARAALDRSQLEATYALATAAARQGSADALANVLNSPTISRLRDQEAEASQRMAELSTRYGSSYPGMRSAGAQLATARRQISDEAGRIIAALGAQLAAARAHEADVQKQLDTARLAGVQAENVRAQLDQLQQEATTRRALYQQLLQGAQQTSAQPTTDQTPDIRVLSPAVAPGQPSGPNLKLAALMGGSAGGLLGCLFAFVRLRRVEGFESADEVTAATGLVVLATLPRRLLRAGRAAFSPAAGRPGGAGPDGEIIRGLIGRVRFAGRTGVPRSVIFVPLADGQAAPVAAAFARIAAADGDRVLLVEADLRSPRLSRQLGHPTAQQGGSSFAAVLGGGFPAEDWHEAVTPDAQPNLDLLLVSQRLPDAQSLLSGAQFQNLLIEAQADYDLVVLHAPLVSEAHTPALAQRVDATILVVDGRGERGAARDAATRLYVAAHTALVAVLLGRT